MAAQHKDSKAKALATASTLQRVVCPSTERDPLELLSSGYRKVDEQKRYTNRLTNLPDKGVGVVSRDGSFSEPPPGPNKGPPRTNGRAVLDQMFGHLRPHHNIAEPALLQMEQTELENGLGDQAARAAFYRPSITAALMAIPADSRLLAADAASPGTGIASTSTSASASGALYRVGNSPMRRGRGGGDDSNQSEDGDTASEPELPAPEDDRPSTASSQRGGSGGYGVTAGASVAGSGGSITAAGRFSSPRTMRPPMGVAAGAMGAPASPGLLSRGPEACNSPMRISANGIGPIPPGAGAGRAGSARRTGGGALPTVSRSYPDGTVAAGSLTMGAQLGCAGTAQPPPGAVLETPRLPAAATQAGAKRGNRRASVSGAEIAAAAAAAAAGLPAIGSGGASPSPGGRARRASLVGGGAGYGATAAVAMGGLPAHSPGPPLVGSPGSQRYSMPGNSVGLSGGSFSSGGNGMPLLSQRGGGAGTSGGGAGADGAATAVASRLGMRSSLPSELALHGSPHSTHGAAGQGPQRSGHSVSVAGTMPGAGPVPRVRLSYSGVGPGAGATHGTATDGGGEGSMWPGAASIGLLAQLQGALHPEGSGPSPPAVNPSVPLSGLDALSATGLGDAISQLRNIRISAAGAPPQGAKEKPKKVEPGLAGVTPLSLLPVPLPPIENWQSGGKSVADLDPCKDIRLVDAPRCILPRATEEQDLQSKMAAHKNAMRELVKAEGAPMSESEMEAVKLLGRLERSGARMRNYGDVDGSEQEAAGAAGAAGAGHRAVVGAA
ncbi:hypothetical protein HXX76_011965 [Chlamydomonas incerta]|uniref:Uncharacterized protein n=1 Tax=Chlamydomonas incerta TaxID=51695 RepID=A0A835VW31_CHLIN|nr:hypothetical protein HXX76_011965 [Chlamydomonas incerta]|eukprot:KAG2427978.1 hypothetical protein HXX76_011965 [Chlamydomonas incerta]